MIGGILAILCLGGVGVFISFYDEATKIERTDPDVVVSSYLRSMLIARSDQEASLFTCKAGGDLSGVFGLRSEMITREQKFGVTVSANWGALTVSGSEPSQRQVTTQITIAGMANNQPVSQRTESWRFALVDEDGWRVCQAEKTS